VAEDEQRQKLWQMQYSDEQYIYSTYTVQHGAPNGIFPGLRYGARHTGPSASDRVGDIKFFTRLEACHYVRLRAF
jgi:hypothetical protein